MDDLDTLSHFAASLRFADLPSTVRAHTGWILADTLAAIAAGSAEPELRSLAQRSASSARETATKIEAAITSSRQGAACASVFGHSLVQIAREVGETDVLLQQISTGAREQAQGLEQISIALGEIDRAAQGNANTAEQSAQAAEALGAESLELGRQIGTLQVLVGSDPD